MSRHPKPSSRSSTPTVTPTTPSDVPTRTTRNPDVVERLGAVVTTGLTKDYGDGHGLERTDLRVELGERVALIGHNGSGKTTLLRMIAGLLDPTGGRASVHGHPAGSLGARGVAAYCADQPTFYDDLSLWEHLEFVARVHGKEDWEQLAADLLGDFGLYERADDLPTRFSRGLRQKAALALTFVRPFGVVLVDEPFVGLDVTGRQVLLELFDDAHAEGATLMVATHEMSFLDQVDRVVVLRDGAIVFDGVPGDEVAEALASESH